MAFDIENDLRLYELGRMLRQVVNTPAWESVIETMQAYRDDARDQLVSLPPGDSNVVCAHAAASALDQFFRSFQDGVVNAVNMANNPSEELKQYLFGARNVNDVSKAMGRGE